MRISSFLMFFQLVDENNNWNWQVVTTLRLIIWLKDGKDIEIYDESNASEVVL